MEAPASLPDPATAIILGAGAGRRLGGIPKAFLLLAGRPMLDRALAAVLTPAEVAAAVVVVPSTRLDEARAVAAAHPKVIAVVAGGEERQDSVAAGLGAAGEAEWVLVHDAARPLASPALVRRVLLAARETGAATAGLAARDTVKVASAGTVTETLDRTSIWLTQTPQAFRRSLLLEAHARAGQRRLRATDDAALVEAMGGAVRVVEGETTNLKITTAEDLAIADALLRAGSPEDRRTGLGYDAHRLVPDRRLVLGGVAIPFDRGLSGHSDADAVLHAVIDGLLGAAGLPDIGQHFPPDDPSYRGADSRVLLAKAVERVRQSGFVPVQVDVVIVAEAPRLASHLPAMRRAIAEGLVVPEGAVGLKATTTDGLGAIGRGEGIAAQAVVTIRRSG
jgi:2-C-methyl-D-erythritol 4-phosphate cytidylyltransferase/2-C-methyl-D-erythritol 2,4-cyclodiphosphate synthase